mmetsp:Transcript_66623/g.164237  ORF Transcript_66623/g.164237 Transcript_66623/m.164237 type:complete len:316 (-) Transcript_66623:157-1104(-)
MVNVPRDVLLHPRDLRRPLLCCRRRRRLRRSRCVGRGRARTRGLGGCNEVCVPTRREHLLAGHVVGAHSCKVCAVIDQELDEGLGGVGLESAVQHRVRRHVSCVHAVGARVEEVLSNLLPPLQNSAEARCKAQVVRDLRLRLAVLHKVPHDRQVPLARRVVQRREPLDVGAVELDVARGDGLDALEVVGEHGHVERRVLLPIRLVGVSLALLDEEVHDLEVAVEGCQMQRRVPQSIARVHVDLAILAAQQLLDPVNLPTVARREDDVIWQRLRPALPLLRRALRRLGRLRPGAALLGPGRAGLEGRHVALAISLL